MATAKATKKPLARPTQKISKSAKQPKRLTVIEKQLQVDAAVKIRDGRGPTLMLSGQYKGIVSIPGWASGESGNNSPSALYSTSPWAKACIDLRANALAQIGWGIFDDQDEELEEHPLIDLLNRVDMEQNWNDLIRATVCDLMIHGQGFWQKVYGRSANGEVEGSVPIRLKRLNAGTMEVEAGRDGIVGFVQQLDGMRTAFKRGEVVFFRDFDPDNDLGGLSPADVTRSAIEIENYADRYLTSFFKNHAVPDLIYTTEQELNDEDYARQKRNLKKFKGVDNQHKSALLEKGIKATVISFPLTDLALETVRLEARRSICAGLGVPMSMIGADPSANFATADNERKSLYTEHVIPQSEYLASVINAELVADFDENLTFAWKSDELPIMQPDAKSEAERLSMLVEKGIIKPLTAALELGYSAKDVPEAAPEQPNPFGPQPGVTPPALEPFANATEQVGQGEQPEQPQKAADLRLWMKKAIARVKAGKSAAVEFESAAIPPALNAAILGQLEGCKIADDVRRVFNQDLSPVEDKGMNAREVIELVKAMKPEPLQIHADNMTANVAPSEAAIASAVKEAVKDVPPTFVTVKVPEQAPAVVNVENIVEAPVVNIQRPSEPTMKASPAQPKLRGRSERQQVKRDAKGNIVTTEGEVEYHYEGEE